MCAHRIIGISLIGLTCSAIVASSLSQIHPGTRLISAKAGDTLASCCGALLAGNYKPRPPAEEQGLHELIVGNWVGETMIEGCRRGRFLAQHFEDGTFRVTVRSEAPDDRASNAVYLGNWSTSGPTYFTSVSWIAEERDIDVTYGQGTANINAYEILEIDDERFEYESFSSRAKFVARRVGEDFGPNDL
jgi:hypothetical protein